MTVALIDDTYEDAAAKKKEIKDKLDGCKGIDTDKEEGKPKLGKKKLLDLTSKDFEESYLFC